MDENDIPEAIMAEARERAIRKAAQMIAERELGILSDDGDAKVVKGPLKKWPKNCVITLDLAEHSNQLRIDGTIYFHGGTYTVDEPTFATMREMIHRGWDHQREVDGKNANAYRKQANVSLNNTNIVNTAQDILASARQNL
jgi:hypothetical protein